MTEHPTNLDEATIAPHTNAAADALLEGLTEPQRQAVTHVDGPLLVLAGPGSGKTRVISHRIANLVLGVGIAPWNILAITFTNKAAGEMRERVARLLSPRQANAVHISTFHSLCARLLRQYGSHVGLSPGYSIYDTGDQQRAMKQALEQLEISTSNFPPAKMLASISNAKNELIDADAYAQTAGDFFSKKTAQIYKKYQQVLEQNNALDFDDLLIKTVQLLKGRPDVLSELRERYQYLLIDEYQDTNHAQFVLANALAAGHKNICATGDPDQSIYGWRGANIRNILEFETHYPDAAVVRLEQNYRSTKRILALADGLIRHNGQRRHKTLWTENEEGEPAEVVTLPDERREADHVLQWFEQVRQGENIPWSGFAVFYRTNSLSRVMEDTLRRAGVPYQIARGTSFYERKEIKDAIAYLRSIVNPADEVNLLRIINVPPRRISGATVKAIQARAVASNQSVSAVIHQPEQLSVNKRAMEAVRAFATDLDRWRGVAGLGGEASLLAHADELSLREFLELVLEESGLEEHYRNDKSDPEGDRIENLGELISSAQQFEDDLVTEAATDPDAEPAPMTLAEKLYDYLERISLVADVDVLDPDQGAVTLMTLHAAKGLEFPVVAMIGLEDGLLPHERSASEGNLEEERRLCFVGITRAQRRLMLTHTRYRTVFGQTMPKVPSSFLAELPGAHLVKTDLSEEQWDSPEESDAASAAVRRQREKAAEQVHAFPPGTLVRHPIFGLGRVLTINASGAQTRARVEFNTAGVKTLVLQFAKLEKVEY